MQATTQLYSVLILFGTLLLSACGTGTTGGGQPSGNGAGSGGRDSVEPAEKVALRIEATDEMLVSWQTELFHLLGPQRAYALEGLVERNDLPETAISIIELDENFREISGGNVPEFEVIKPRGRDGYEIWFKELLIEQANLVIRVRLTRNEILYAPLYSTGNESNPIVVNVGSHFVLKKLFDQINSPEQLQALRECQSEDNCTNQIQAKAAVVANASRMIQNYEIEIESNQNIASALATLESQRDLTLHIEAMMRSITETNSPIAKGTPRPFTITDGNIRTRLNYNVDHNSVWLGFQMNDYRPAPVNSQKEVLLSIANSRIVSADELDGPFPAYPALNQNTSLLDIRRDSISADIPFERSTLLINENGNTNFELNDELNSFGFSTSDTFLNTEGFLLNDRNILQTINDERTVGWSFSPMFSLLYKANDFEPDTSTDNTSSDQEREYDASPTWLMASNYSRGGRFDNNSPSGIFTRGDQQEALNLFSWEIHGQETTEAFSRSDINGKDYGVVAYSVQLDQGGKLLEIFAETYNWDAVSNDFFESNVTTYTTSRGANNAINPVMSSTTQGLGDRDFYLVSTLEATQEFPEGNFFTQGLLGLDPGTENRGHSSEDGRHLAFSTKNDNRGRGLIVATQMRPSSAEPIFSGESYRLQGNSIGFENMLNFAFTLNNSLLTINDRQPGDPAQIDCNATLQFSAVRLDHDTTENTLSEPEDWVAPVGSNPGPVNSSSCILNGGKIEIEFDELYDRTLRLEGFVSTQGTGSSTDSTPGRVINMIWIHEDNLGLVFANQEQTLSPTFGE